MDEATLISRIRDLSSQMDPIPTEQDARLQTLTSIHCVAFDFYGTMFLSGVGDIGIDEEQSSENLYQFQEALLDTGFDVTSDRTSKQGLIEFDRAVREYKEQKRSQGIDHPEPDIVFIWHEVLNKLIENRQIEGSLSREVAQRFAIEYEFRFNSIWPVSDLMETIASLHRRRFILGIISNSQFYTPLAFKALTNRDIADTGFDRDLLVWSYQASVKKPSIDLYERFVTALKQKHNLQPEQVLYVGNDMLKDIMPASKLGMKTALFAGDARSLKLRPDDPHCKGIEPDIIVTELSQITDCVDNTV